MRKILLNRLSEIQGSLKQAKDERASLHPKSKQATEISILIFQYNATITELTYLLNICHEN
jgi:hypothetical protein